MLNARDRGGTRLAAGGTQGRGVVVRCRPLLAVVTEAGLAGIDALKIDVEGFEDKVLVPFFRDAPPSLWPRLDRDRGFQRRMVDRPVRAARGEGLRGLLAQQAERDAAATRRWHEYLTDAPTVSARLDRAIQ